MESKAEYGSAYAMLYGLPISLLSPPNGSKLALSSIMKAACDSGSIQQSIRYSQS